jgi:disease resistance protein RPM1
MFGLEGQTKVLNRLGEFSLLRVLDLEDCESMEDKHLEDVCRLSLLKFLSLRGTPIRYMPLEIGKLENLETLDVHRTYLPDLPDTVTDLEKLEVLRHSYRDGYDNCWIARRGLGRMKALQVLNEVMFGCDVAAAKELGELQELTELYLVLHNAEDVTQILAESLSKINTLRQFSIACKAFGPKSTTLGLLHDLKAPPRLLQMFRICGGINKLPAWIGSLTYLTKLYISWTYLVDDQLYLPVCELQNLCDLSLEAYTYVGPKLVARADHTFPALKYLFLNFDISQGMEVLQFQENSMTKLEKLHVRFLHQGSKEVVGIEHLTSIKEVVLEGTKDNPALPRVVEQLQKLNGKRQSKKINVAVRYEQ